MTIKAPKTRKKTAISAKKAKKAFCGTTDPAYNVACYYGVHIAPKVNLDKDDQALIRSVKQLEGDDSFACAEDKVAILKAYGAEHIQNLSQPVMLWNENSYGGKKGKKRTIHLDILGTTKSIAEATLLQAAVAILEEEGLQDLMIDINSIGNKDIINRFQREISNYYKKNLNSVSATCRHIFKKDALAAHTCALEEGDEIAAGAPQAISFLNDESRTHFQEVLEFLETLNLDYKINNALVGHRGYSSDTIFTISASDNKGGSVVVAAVSLFIFLLWKKHLVQQNPLRNLHSSLFKLVLKPSFDHWRLLRFFERTRFLCIKAFLETSFLPSLLLLNMKNFPMSLSWARKKPWTTPSLYVI
jgi:hypothetical protein